MTIAPVRRSVIVQAPPARAFDLFTRDVGRWWPRTHTIGQRPLVDVVLEPCAGGRWFERAEAGAETDWGRVIAWEPPTRLLLSWQVTSRWKFDPTFSTEVHVTFAPEGTGTRVTLEHRNLERFGADADKIAEQVGTGWPTVLEAFARYAAGGTT